VVEPSFPLDRPLLESLPARRLQRWQETTPIATTGHEGLQRVLRRGQQDLGALRIFDPEDPSLAAVAAGAPWFMALFGRDSLLTAYVALPVDRSLALGTLRTLARHQGSRTDPLTEEEPGRILHEVQLGVESGLSLGGGPKVASKGPWAVVSTGVPAGVCRYSGPVNVWSCTTSTSVIAAYAVMAWRSSPIVSTQTGAAAAASSVPPTRGTGQVLLAAAASSTS
jgi:hypothetical protein